MPQLALLVDGVVVNVFPLEKPVTTIGRDQSNDIQIDEAGVSARHAQIRLQPSELLDDQIDVVLEDLGSTNGSLVNDVDVVKCQIKHNDVITIGWNTFKLLDGKSGSETTAHIIRG